MRSIIVALLFGCFATLAHAGPARLLLIPAATLIKPGADVRFDVYVCNDSQRPTKVPSLKLLSSSYVLRDTTGARLPRFHSSTQNASHVLSEHLLEPNAFARTRIQIKIPAERGDVVEVYAEIAGESGWRSNTVLLFCPTEKASR